MESNTFYSIFIRSGILNDLNLSPARTLGSSLSLPFINQMGLGLGSPTRSVVMLPSINPVLQSAGL